MQENKTFRRLNPRLDPNFKAIFTQDTPDSRLALKSFLSAMTGGNVSDVTVKENQKASQYEGQRGILYDINCVFADGTKAQVEMQGYDKGLAYGRRSEYYASRLVSSVADVGDDWENLPKAYQISVLNLKYDEGNNDPLHHYVLADVKDGAQLEGIINVIFLELPKLPEIKEDTDIESLPSAIKWGKFIQEADNPEKQGLIDRLTKSEGGIMSADAMLRSLSDDSWRWIEQGRIEGAERDRTS
ncbi:MAG: PD-(D/E)XK nuclease family transposase, partial [Treponema sp.]|nr:PD-(D/E)XK nuclease family transposase [Treponema sp.]